MVPRVCTLLNRVHEWLEASESVQFDSDDGHNCLT
jgi:hypothetical protein